MFLRALCLLVALPLSAFAVGEKIAVIPKGTTHTFWRSVEKGARKAGAELGAEVVWKGPLKEDDRAQQIAVVQQFIGDNTDAIVLAPLDDTALRAPVHSAMQRGKPVVIIDSALKGEAPRDFVSFVATNNRRGGELAGEELARLLNGRGKVAILRFAEGSASTTAREEGFLTVVGRHPDIEVIVENRYAGPTISTAQDSAMNLIDKLRAADAIFTPSETVTQGMLLALRQTGLARRKLFIGFDSSPLLVSALKRGDIKALVVQNPSLMGYLGVRTAVAKLRGEPIDDYIDTGCLLVTRDNLDSPEARAVLGN